MDSEAVIASVIGNYELLIAALQRIEIYTEAKSEYDHLARDSVTAWSLDKLVEKTANTSKYKHRVHSQLLELAGSLQSTLSSRHYFAGATGTETPASRAAVIAIVAGLEKCIQSVPATSQWVPVTACNEVIRRIRTE